MTRSLTMATAAALAIAMVLAISAAPQAAQAQDLSQLEAGTGDANPGVDAADDDADFEVGRGVHFIRPDIQPSDSAGSGADANASGGTGGGDAGAGLAVTGSDVEPVVAIAAGLLAIGGSALVASRRRLRSLG